MCRSAARFLTLTAAKGFEAAVEGRARALLAISVPQSVGFTRGPTEPDVS